MKKLFSRSTLKFFFLLSILLGCKSKETEPVLSTLVVDSRPVEGDYSIFITNPSSDIGLIRRYPKLKLDIIASGNRDSEGFLTNINTTVIYNPNSKDWVATGYEKGYPVRITTSNGYSADLKNYNKKDLTVDMVVSLKGAVIKTIEKQKLKDSFFTNVESNPIKGARGISSNCELYKKSMQGLGIALGATALLVAVAFPPAGILEGILLANTAIGVANSFSELVSDETLTKKIFNDKTADLVESGIYFLSFLDLRPKPDVTVDLINKILAIPTKATDVPLDPCKPFYPSHGTGDPHLLTHDGTSYDFQGHGEFISTKSTVDNFEIQVRQEDINKTGYVTMNTGIAIQTGTDVVCVTVNPNRLFVNNKVQDLANLTTLTLNGGASITKAKEKGLDVLNVTNKNGDLIKVVFQSVSYLDYFLYLADNRKGKVLGLLGNYDGDKTNDIQIRNGENILKDGSLSFDKLYPNYADSWRVAKANSLFTYDSGKDTDSYTQKAFPHSLQILTADQKSKAEVICRAAGVTTDPFLSNCIFDVAITNNPALANSAFFGQQSDARNSLPIPIIQEAVSVKRITTFGVRSYILKSDGTLWASGKNDHGEFGIGTPTLTNKNLFIKIMDGIKDIASGNTANHMLFLKNDNTVWAAGYNNIGQIGNGPPDAPNVLTAVKIMNDGKALAISDYSSFVIKTDNTLWAFGEGVILINGSKNFVNIPTKVFDDVKDIAVNGQVLILKTDNTLWVSGSKVMDNVKSVSAGQEFSMIVKNDNTLWGMGNNRFGELGNGKNVSQAGFVKIVNDVQSVSVGNFYSLILKTDNTLWATGNNINGQLGDGTKVDKNTFTKVMSNVKYVSTGGNTTFIVKEDNTVWASGYNETGKLGDGTTFDRLSFVPINVK